MVRYCSECSSLKLAFVAFLASRLVRCCSECSSTKLAFVAFLASRLVRCCSGYSSRFFFNLCTFCELAIFTLPALQVLHRFLRVPCIQTCGPPHRAQCFLAFGFRQHAAHQHSEHSFRTRGKSASPSLELSKHSAHLAALNAGALSTFFAGILARRLSLPAARRLKSHIVSRDSRL